MMKFNALLAAALLLAAGPAQAARAEASGDGMGVSKIAACEAAKVSVRGNAAVAAMRAGWGPVTIVRYGECLCQENPSSPPASRWSCEVNATYATTE